MLVYKATNRTNGKVYIGKTVRTLQGRWREHVRLSNLNLGCSYLGAAIRKYGVHAFELEGISEVNSREELSRLEKFYIQQYKSYQKQFGYNLTLGGDGGIICHTLETRRRIAAGRQGADHPMYGKHQSREARQRISEHNGRGFLGKRHTMVSRQRMGVRGEDHPNFGKHLSESTKDKIRVINSKTYRLQSPDGSLVDITNLKAFCKNRGLSAPHLNSVFHGKKRSHKGWTKC